MVVMDFPMFHVMFKDAKQMLQGTSCLYCSCGNVLGRVCPVLDGIGCIYIHCNFL